MISKHKTYDFNQRTLNFERKRIPTTHIIRRFIRFFSISSLFAIVLISSIFLIAESPLNIILKKQINSIKHDYVILNSEIDNLRNTLHTKHFIDDRYFRELLNLDSLSAPMRYAGIGGGDISFDMAHYPYNKMIASTATKLTATKTQIRFQDKSYDVIFKEALLFSKKLSCIPAIQPVKQTKNIWISSYFGMRKDPFTFLRQRHKGIDFAGPKNTKIYATADGIVTFTKISYIGYGKEVVISHINDYSTRYAHLNKILVKEGEEVKRGQLIGLMGNSGRSTGTHLHYEIRVKNRPVNPIYYYSDDLTEKEYELITNRIKVGGDN